MRKRLVIGMAAGVLLLAGCGDGGFVGSAQQLRDLEGVPITDPDKARIVVNVEGFPNAVALCIEGVGFIATTREDRPLQESPGLTEKWCAQ